MGYTYFHDVRHPSEMGTPEVEAFLTHINWLLALLHRAAWLETKFQAGAKRLVLHPGLIIVPNISCLSDALHRQHPAPRTQEGP